MTTGATNNPMRGSSGREYMYRVCIYAFNQYRAGGKAGAQFELALQEAGGLLRGNAMDPRHARLILVELAPGDSRWNDIGLEAVPGPA